MARQVATPRSHLLTSIFGTFRPSANVAWQTEAFMLALRLPPEIEARLAELARRTGRTKSFYAREAILNHLDELEDIYLAESRLKDLREGRSGSIALSDLIRRHGVEDWVRAREAARELDRLDPQSAWRILRFVRDRVGPREDARSIGQARKATASANFGDTGSATTA
jgi:RHH-type rel operon transcriptional repressor/antitoxin RelB